MLVGVTTRHGSQVEKLLELDMETKHFSESEGHGNNTLREDIDSLMEGTSSHEGR